jgi:hypothetical protein
VIGEDIIGVFASLGDMGMLLALVIIILIDGTGFPTLPEVWMVWILNTGWSEYVGQYHPFAWGFAVVIVASLASLGGNFILYTLVKVARPPRWIRKAMKKYTDFLIVSDERLLLLNRLAPVVPYTGAFMAVCDWNVKKCALYLITGAMAKATVVTVLSWLSYDNFRKEVAPWIALGAVAAVMVVSIVASLIYKKKIGLRGGPARSQS